MARKPENDDIMGPAGRPDLHGARSTLDAHGITRLTLWTTHKLAPWPESVRWTDQFACSPDSSLSAFVARAQLTMANMTGRHHSGLLTTNDCCGLYPLLSL